MFRITEDERHMNETLASNRDSCPFVNGTFEFGSAEQLHVGADGGKAIDERVLGRDEILAQVGAKAGPKSSAASTSG